MTRDSAASQMKRRMLPTRCRSSWELLLTRSQKRNHALRMRRMMWQFWKTAIAAAAAAVAYDERTMIQTRKKQWKQRRIPAAKMEETEVMASKQASVRNKRPMRRQTRRTGRKSRQAVAAGNGRRLGRGS